jgi:Superinfection immunity protein
VSYPSGDQHVDPATGAQYVWDGAHWVQQGDSQTLAYGAGQQAPPAPTSSYAPPQPQYSAPYPQTVAGPAYVSDKGSKNIQAIIAWIIAVLTFGYMLPWAIAATRGKSNAGMIGILNLLLGWTLIGWIVALVMACNAHQIAATAPSVSVVTAVGVQNAYPYPPPNGYYGQPAPNPNFQAYQQRPSTPQTVDQP